MKHKLTNQQLKNELARASVIVMGLNVFVRSRKKELVYERNSVQYLLKTRYRYSYESIGYMTSSSDPFDHATILHSVKKVASELTTYADRSANIAKWQSVLNDIENLKLNDEAFKWLVAKREEANESEQKIIDEILNNLGYGK